MKPVVVPIAGSRGGTHRHRCYNGHRPAARTRHAARTGLVAAHGAMLTNVGSSTRYT
ncbi:hypothetical protein AK34_5487 [Burkholderia dolosa AU0158]|nr:hypothetical protein AK34_5487 [Burkholderia dolosa AU0158]VWB27216.1 hypothetical protein BDO18943_01121 [Burkholderia dolosa]